MRRGVARMGKAPTGCLFRDDTHAAHGVLLTNGAFCVADGWLRRAVWRLHL